MLPAIAATMKTAAANVEICKVRDLGVLTAAVFDILPGHCCITRFQAELPLTPDGVMPRARSWACSGW
jgi:hypothetical protein